MFKIFKMMKFEYNIDLFWSYKIFEKVSGFPTRAIIPEKRHFAVYVIFRNRLLIYGVREILSKFDSRNAQFGVRKATRGRPEVIQVRPGGSRRSVLIRKSFSRADT